MKKLMSEEISIVKFSSYVSRVSMMTMRNNKNKMKEINELSALVCLLLAIALIKNCWLGEGAVRITFRLVYHSFSLPLKISFFGTLIWTSRQSLLNI